MKAGLALFHRWIDDAWYVEGLEKARPNWPPWKLEALPIGIILVAMASSGFEMPYIIEGAIVVIGCGIAGLLHLYFGWRLMFISSLTSNSDRIAKGIHVTRESSEED